MCIRILVALMMSQRLGRVRQKAGGEPDIASLSSTKGILICSLFGAYKNILFLRKNYTA